jgi:hypothetical protein
LRHVPDNRAIIPMRSPPHLPSKNYKCHILREMLMNRGSSERRAKLVLDLSRRNGTRYNHSEQDQRNQSCQNSNIDQAIPHLTIEILLLHNSTFSAPQTIKFYVSVRYRILVSKCSLYSG